MPRDPQAPSNVLDYVQTRAELRNYIDRELPGWHCWLDTALVVLGTREADELHLVPKDVIIERLELLADEMCNELGELGARIGRDYAQQAPFFDLSEQRALEPWTRWQNEVGSDELPMSSENSLPLPTGPSATKPFSHQQLGNRVASRDVIGNLLALGYLRTLSQQRRTGLEARRRWAAQLVGVDLLPYTSDALPLGPSVIPPQYEDPGFNHQLARPAPISRALAVVVVVYLGLPGPLSPGHDGGNQLELPTNAFAKASEKLREAEEHPDADPWLLRQGVDLRQR